MDPIFTEEQLNRMSSKDMRSLLKIMMQHQQKQEETLQKQGTRIPMPRNRTWKRSIHLLTEGKNVPAKKRKTFPPLRQPK